jgi:asparagine synthase (glutamine-hydrolysing)
MRDLMKHRGPDGEGLWMNHHVAFAHRRLSILDLKYGQQPYHLGAPNSSDHQVLSFNGEIYNHRALRVEMEALGIRFETQCDTETLAKAWACWGVDTLSKLRGMFAFAVYEAKHQRVTMVRDPMGIKPLYYAIVQTQQGCEVVFASEPLSVLAHPSISVQPDWVTVSSYLTTVRTTLGHRSMYQDVNVLQPGELVEIDLSGDAPKLTNRFWYQGKTESMILTLEEAMEETRTVVTESIDSHLLSDVNNSSLLSGGLDSTIITARASDHIPNLKTWCTGMTSASDRSQVNLAGDVEHAMMAAQTLGTDHHMVPIDHHQFNHIWPWMIKETGLPLSTPNQVSIYQAAKSLSSHAKVALSGEGADEIFAGYDAQLMPFANYLRSAQRGLHRGQTPLDFYLQMTSWVPVQLKADILNPYVMGQANQDYLLIEELQQIFGSQKPEHYGLAHMMMAQRQFNLTGLLERLDSSTMLAGVEGRTPFADIRVSEFADQMPMGYHFSMNQALDSVTSKQLLRRAFADRVPGHVLNRPKASFPLPFQSWMATQGQGMLKSALTKEVFHHDAMIRVAEQSTNQWATAWPMLNISMWLESVWGSQAVRRAA